MIEFENEATVDEPYQGGMMPMVDVIFTLIAFMMLIINAPLNSMDVDLPVTQQQGKQHSPQQPITLKVISEKSLWRIDEGTALDFESTRRALQKMLQERSAATTTLLAIDKSAPAQRIVDTLELLQEAGVDDAQIMLAPSQ